MTTPMGRSAHSTAGREPSTRSGVVFIDCGKGTVETVVGTVVESIAGILERSEALRTLCPGEDLSDRRSMRRSVDATIGAVMGTVAFHVEEAIGARMVWDVVVGDDGWLLDGTGERDWQLPSVFFGSARTVLERRLVHHTGLDQRCVAAFMSKVLAVYLDHLRRRVVHERLDVQRFRRAVLDEHEQVGRLVPLLDFFDALDRPAGEFHEAIRRLRFEALRGDER